MSKAKFNKGDLVLERFMKEFFPFAALKKIGLFTKEMKGDYPAQAKRICTWLGYETIYEYRATEIRCHISYTDDEPLLSISPDGKLKERPFITVIPSIYE